MTAISRRILISAPKESVESYLRDLRNLAEYGRRVETIEVSYPDAESGLVEVAGRFLGLPWRGSFRMEFTRDGGYRSEMLSGPLRRLAGGVHLRQVSGGTLVTREEQYQLPLFLRPAMALLRGWMGRALESELGAIKEGAERLHRLRQVSELES